MMDAAIGRMLLELVQGGTRLVLESGAGFLRPTETAAHQRMLFRCFELEVEPPVDLWSGKLADDDLFASRSSPHRRKTRSEEHTSELQSLRHLVCRRLLEKKNTKRNKSKFKRHDTLTIKI